MKTKILLMIGLVLLVLLVGCGTNTQPTNTQQSQPFVGGGCGVKSIDSNNEIKELPMWSEL